MLQFTVSLGKSDTISDLSIQYKSLWKPLQLSITRCFHLENLRRNNISKVKYFSKLLIYTFQENDKGDPYI